MCGHAPVGTIWRCSARLAVTSFQIADRLNGTNLLWVRPGLPGRCHEDRRTRGPDDDANPGILRHPGKGGTRLVATIQQLA